MKIKVKKLHPAAILPKYATDGSACFDIAVHGYDWNLTAKAYGVSLRTLEGVVFSTGLAFEIPAGHVMLVFSRSGHGFNNNVRLANSVGVIDSDYRGELKVKLVGDGFSGLVVKPGDRIAQAMILPIPAIDFEEVPDLSPTDRSEGGFGSTGS